MRDVHSFAEPHRVRIVHLDLELACDFERRMLRGTALLRLALLDARCDRLVLDTRKLHIGRVELSDNGADFRRGAFEVGAADPLLGSPLTILLPNGVNVVRIEYATDPEASGLQWLEPQETAGGDRPFLLTQSEEIHARSWVPLQDTPQVRFTLRAAVEAPGSLTVVMGAARATEIGSPGMQRFELSLPIPSYLLALAAGGLDFCSTGPRSGVYAEPPVLESAVREFNGIEDMMQAAERICGPYRWGRYDLLVLPPSFPFGGMENPCVSFITPTVISGDRMLNSLIAHELAHSWSGNLVSNATWADYWLNEGFATHIERRVQEHLYGATIAAMEDALASERLRDDLQKLPPRDQALCLDLDGRDPEEANTQVAYVKGALLLKTIESNIGRGEFDDFLHRYFDHFAFQSITTTQFVEFLTDNVLRDRPEAAARIALDDWLHGPGLPDGVPRVTVDAFSRVERSVAEWLAGRLEWHDLPTDRWTTYEWLHFFSLLPERLDPGQMAMLDDASLSARDRNTEILAQWLLLVAKNRYSPGERPLAEFLMHVGRSKMIKPLYEELIKTPEGQRWAERVYSDARRKYHPIIRVALDKVIRSTD